MLAKLLTLIGIIAILAGFTYFVVLTVGVLA